MKRILFLIFLGLMLLLTLFCTSWRLLSILSITTNNEINVETITQLTTNLITAVAVIGTVLIVLIVTVVACIFLIKDINSRLGFGEDEASMKRQLEDKLGSSRKSIAAQLGVGDNNKSITAQLGVGSNDKSITAQIGITSKSITEQLGVGVDDKSITAQLGITSKSVTEQHREMYDAIIQQTDKISSIYEILHDNQIRQDAENTSQANLAATIAAFQQNYILVLNENSKLKSENLSLKSEKAILRGKIMLLQAHSEESNKDTNDEDMGL